MGAIRVETYSGYKPDEYPVRFWIDGIQYEILEIEDRWYSPQTSYFKVFTTDAGHYILAKNEADNTWELRQPPD